MWTPSSDTKRPFGFTPFGWLPRYCVVWLSAGTSGPRGHRLGGRQVHVMGLLVDRDRACAALGRDVLENLPFPACLLHDRQRPIAVRAKCIPGARVERCAVGPSTNRQGGRD